MESSPEVRVCYCGMTAPVEPGVFPHRDCDGSISVGLKAKWYAKPNDLIGGWCVMDVDATPAESGRYEIADFISEELAKHIAALHNLWLGNIV